MGNCSQKPLSCFFCNTMADNDIYIVTITHLGNYDGKNICSLCYEQKVLEKHKFNTVKEILPINTNKL